MSAARSCDDTRCAWRQEQLYQPAGAVKGLAALGKRVAALLVLPVVVPLQELEHHDTDTCSHQFGPGD